MFPEIARLPTFAFNLFPSPFNLQSPLLRQNLNPVPQIR